MEKVEDRRARKTRKAIQNAFMKLMLKKDISRITIKDLSEVADINRSTFYLHYYDIYDVFEDIEKETVEGIFEIIKDFDVSELVRNPFPLLKSITEEMDVNPDFSQFLIGSTVSSNFLNKIKKQFKSRLVSEYKKLFPNEKNTDKIALAITFITGGTIDVYEEWVNDGKLVPLSEFCKNVSEQISKGISGIFNN